MIVDTVHCHICGRKEVVYPVKLEAAETLCPQCNTPICPECANLYEKRPATLSAAQKYIEAADADRSKVFCGQCGNFGRPFLLRYFKIIGCPIPSCLLDDNVPERIQTYLQARVALLPDSIKLADEAVDAFVKGYRGIIKLKHESQVIWAIPEKIEGKWIMTLCYPEDR